MRNIPWIHIILFLLTVITTLGAGALWEGVDIFSEPSRIPEGWPFSLTLLSILLSHEFSHYIASRLHKTKASLPYFIPAPTVIGTFGAIIKMKSPITTRKALIDIGAAGPIAGFIVSIVATVIGLELSEISRKDHVEEGVGFGASIIFLILVKAVMGDIPDGYTVILHPVALAGWIGFLVTSLNLIPVGQLDGGHIIYALFGRRHKYISLFFVVSLIILGILAWYGWLIWAGLLVILGLKHPPVLFWEDRLVLSRKITGIISILIFILSFIPVPLQAI
ncbi:MAG: site-2 protease family protein [Thermodesulfovibrionales bacterium]|nr:site-2 protease family protein [Thermodesulfovibrionales bacterium]